MSKRARLADAEITTFAERSGWALRGGALVKSFSFGDYAAGIAFVVRLGFAAEKRDHHPDMHVGWRKVEVTWTTHDAGGVTALDVEMAEATDALAAHP